MIDIKTLREKCQAPTKTTDTWYVLNFERRVSIYITFLFIKLGIRAMCATTVFLLSGIIAAMVFFLGGRTNFLIGVLILQLWYILDHVDGEVARYNEETSLTGMYFDTLVHYIVHPLVFFGIGWGVFHMTGNAIYAMSGIIGGLSVMVMSLIVDLKMSVLFSKFQKCLDSDGSNISVKLSNRGISTDTLVRKIFSKIYLLCTFPFIMNVMTVAAIVDFLFRTMIMAAVLLVYAVLITIVWIMRLTIFIIERRVDLDNRSLLANIRSK